jgi:hypothetical protein
MTLFCASGQRRAALRRTPGWNGIDYAEIDADQRTLRVWFLGKLPPELAVDQPGIEHYLRIEGGRRITGIRILDADPVVDPNPDLDDQLVLRLDRAGDFSSYTVRLVGVANIAARYDRARFTFKIGCPSDLDCAAPPGCATTAPPEPNISYLAKDFASFRSLIFDRLALLMPDWQERHLPDLGVTLVELLAYSGDMLSYYQDAVATEAYLDTARLRISVRRHARLVDYRLHEGCNARAFVSIATDTDVDLPLAGTAFITGAAPGAAIAGWDTLGATPDAAHTIFEALLPAPEGTVSLVAAHSTIAFYTWGDELCCLARGSLGATLLDCWLPGEDGQRALRLRVGDILILEEVRGARTGLAVDADPRRRHAVRLASVTPGVDPVVITDGRPTPYVEVTWAPDDALPFALCLSALGPAPACAMVDGISVAHGNVVLVDHGWTRASEDLGSVPAVPADALCECAGQPGEVAQTPGRIRPMLQRPGITFAAPPEGASASALLHQDVRAAVALVTLESQPALPWRVRPDLLVSTAQDADVVVEIDNDGYAQLRFGDGELGLQPPAGMHLQARYRTGSGVAGNVGADSITGIVMRAPPSGLTLTLRNPLAATGGQAPEPMAEAKLFAPHQFRTTLARAVTADDYRVLAERHAGVQRASAALVWTGSWYEADVAIDPLGTALAEPALLDAVAAELEGWRRIGHDLHVKGATYVPLHLELQVCALPWFQRAHVKAALLDAFSSRALADGTLGYFHPDRLTFGEHVFASRIVALAQAIDGVECATVTVLQRLYQRPNRELENGFLRLAPGEIAQLDNDPDYPEHGLLIIDVKGGRA